MISRILWYGEVRSAENTIEGDHGKSFARAVRCFLKEDDGEAESAKSEMMVASSVLL